MNCKMILAGLTGALLLACARQGEPVTTTIRGLAQGTTYSMVFVADSTLHIQPQIDSLLDRVDRSLSLYNPESLLSRINRNETDSVDELVARCIAVAEQVSRQSGGVYDVTIKPVIAAYGFAGGQPTRNPNIDSLMQYVGYEKIAVRDGRIEKADPHIEIDLNSVAQGITSDYIGTWLESQGIDDYLVEVGGEIFARGARANGEPWRVGIDRPLEGNIVPGNDLIARIALPDGKGLNTSGNYRKFYTDGNGQKIVHTIDASSGRSVVSNLLSATVIAENAALADAYGTAFMAMGLERSKAFLREHPGIEGYLIYSDDKGDMKEYMTPGMARLIIR